MHVKRDFPGPIVVHQENRNHKIANLEKTEIIFVTLLSEQSFRAECKISNEIVSRIKFAQIMSVQIKATHLPSLDSSASLTN